MSRKTALIITTALTAFVLIVAGALAVRLGISHADPALAVSVDPTTANAPVATEIVQQREALYRQRLDLANAQLEQAYGQMQQLQTQLQQIQMQNATLLEREVVFQQRLEEANSMLQQGAATVQSWPSGPAGVLQAWLFEHDDEREHEENGGWEHEEYERREYEMEWGEWDDD